MEDARRGWRSVPGDGERSWVSPFESPDTYLYFAKPAGVGGFSDIWRMPIDGGEEELVLEQLLATGDWALHGGGYLLTLTARRIRGQRSSASTLPPRR